MARKAIRVALTAIVLSAPNLPLAATPNQKITPVDSAELIGTLNLKGEVFHVQGVDIEGNSIWVTSVDVRKKRGYIQEFDRTSGKLLRRLDLTDGARYHPGGFSISGNSIWVPVAEYRSNSSAVIAEIDISTLQIRRKIRVNDHLGCAAANGKILVAGNWDSKKLYVFDLTTGKKLRVVPNLSGTKYQDMKFVAGQLVASGLLGWSSGSIDWIDYPSMKRVKALRTGATGKVTLFGRAKPYSAEGMALRGRELYLLPEDNPSRLFHFRLDDTLPSGLHQLATRGGLASN